MSVSNDSSIDQRLEFILMLCASDYDAQDDQIMKDKTDRLLDAFLDDDDMRMLSHLRSDTIYDFALMEGQFKLPNILRNECTPLMMASFLGATKCVRMLIDLSANPKAVDGVGLTVAHFACAGGVFDICRELDNLGVDFQLSQPGGGSPALFACEFGRVDIVFWLWTRGAILADPIVGWRELPGQDPDVICFAALHGHSQVLRTLVETIGIKCRLDLHPDRDCALSFACANGHDEVIDVLFELGARITTTVLPAAVRSGSFKCVEKLIDRHVAVDRELIELATASGHADVLDLLIRVSHEFGDSWVIAWLNGFGDGIRVLERAGATPQWTLSGVARLTRTPGKAAEFDGVTPITEEAIRLGEWRSEELQLVVARSLHNQRISPSVVHVLVQESRGCLFSAFQQCTTADFANLVLPNTLSRIDKLVFCTCSQLKEIVIPEGVMEIGLYAFGHCSALEHVHLPSTLTTIGVTVFCECIALRSATIPAAVAQIGMSCFQECVSLTNMTFPGALDTIECFTFAGCAALKEVIVPPTVKRIGHHAFERCVGLTHLVVQSNQTEIGVRAFKGCIRLNRIDIAVGSIAIAMSAFVGCPGAQSLTINGHPFSIEDISSDEGENIGFQGGDSGLYSDADSDQLSAESE
jgi:hypothetical protein